MATLPEFNENITEAQIQGEDHDQLPPKMRKKWNHRKLKGQSMSAGELGTSPSFGGGGRCRSSFSGGVGGWLNLNTTMATSMFAGRLGLG